MTPINYQIINPQEAIMGGLRIGAGIAELDQERAKQEQLRVQQEAAQRAAMQQQEALRDLAMNPNAGHSDYARVMTQYPSLAENLGKSFKVLDEGTRQNELNYTTRIYGALQAGRADLASEMLEERAKADPANANNFRMMADMAKEAPGAAKTMAAMKLAAILGPDKFATAFPAFQGELRAAEQAPAELRRKEADATAAVADATIKGEKAKVAAQDVALDLEKKGWDIKALQADMDYKKESSRIAAMNAAISREGNDLKRQELRMKIEEAVVKRDDKVREKVATAEAAAAATDNMLNTIERLKGNKSLDSVLGTVEGRLPAVFSDDAADAIALIDTLGSQAFIEQIKQVKVPGALTEKEGDKLQSSLQNLSRAQSEKQFRAGLDEISRLLLKGRSNLSKSTGVPLGKPDTPAAPGARPPLSSFDRSTGGATGSY